MPGTAGTTIRNKLWASRILWGAIGCLLAFTVMAHFVDYEVYIIFVHMLRVSVSAVVIVAYGTVLYDILTSRTMDRVSQLILGILCSWTAEALLALWFIWWRSGDDTWLWMQTSDVVGGLLILKMMGGVLHITAPGSLDGKVPRRNWLLLTVAISLAVGVSGFIIGMNWGSFLKAPL